MREAERVAPRLEQQRLARQETFVQHAGQKSFGRAPSARPSVRELADALGERKSTLHNAQQHVAAVERYPFMELVRTRAHKPQGGCWPQRSILK